MSSKEQKTFNATPEGQRAMCQAADSIGTALYMNRVVKEKGGTGWDPAMIASANPIMLRAIKEDLIEEFNGLCAKTQAKADEYDAEHGPGSMGFSASQ